MRKSMLIDPSKCMGCRSCQVACKQWNQLPGEATEFKGTYENPPQISPITWMRIRFNEVEEGDDVKWLLSKQGCMHCVEAACMIVCPVGAIYHTESGVVAVDAQKCIGCNYCAASCPFQTIPFDRKTNLPAKCTFCQDRVVNNMTPACAQACPTGAITYGDRGNIVAATNNRITFLRQKGIDAQPYGLEELGGMGMVYVLERPPELYGLPADPQVPFSARVWGALFRPLRFFILLAVGFGLWSNKAQSTEVQSAIKDSEEKRSESNVRG